MTYNLEDAMYKNYRDIVPNIVKDTIAISKADSVEHKGNNIITFLKIAECLDADNVGQLAHRLSQIKSRADLMTKATGSSPLKEIYDSVYKKLVKLARDIRGYDIPQQQVA